MCSDKSLDFLISLNIGGSILQWDNFCTHVYAVVYGAIGPMVLSEAYGVLQVVNSVDDEILSCI